MTPGRRARATSGFVLAFIVLATTGCQSTPATGTAAVTRNAAAHLCGSRAAVTPPVSYQHVIWIWMENHSYSQIIGKPGTTAAGHSPYVNATVVPQCGLATNYHNITHPSLPNYLASVAGSTGGVTTDCGPASCPQSGSSIFGQLDAAKRPWRGYAEDMPSNCSLTSTKLYAARHNPAVYYTGVRTSCAASDVPMGTTGGGAFHDALAANALPAFSFITPNLCHDTHDCSVATGDSWLANWLPVITGSTGYKSGNTAVFVVWDEGENGSSNTCTTNTTDIGCHVAALVLSPYTHPGTKGSPLFSHYSLLRTTETLLGLPRLGHAADSSTAGMRSAFHL